MSLRFSCYIVIFCFTVVLFTPAWAQEIAPTKYWVHFTDKNYNYYSLDNPLAYLTQKSIDRRAKSGTQIEFTDLPVNPDYITDILNSGNITLLNVSKWFNCISIQTTDTLALDTLFNKSYVKTVNKKGYRLKSSLEQFDKFKILEPIETGKAEASEEMYGQAWPFIEMLNVNYLHNFSYDGSGITIAVFDAGFSGVDVISGFSYLRNRGGIIGVYDFVEHDFDVYGSHTHGTNVLSTMAGVDSGSYIGTAPNASYWLFKTEDGSGEYWIEEDNWVAAAEYADSIGVDIINSSLGYTTFDDSNMDWSYADLDGNTTRITQGADLAAKKGILVVNSVGNSGNSSWYYLGAPSDGDSVMAVGAVSLDRSSASFSSHGPSADGDIKPNVSTPGSQVAVFSASGSIMNSSGTSFSSPILAGAAASLWQVDPTKSNMEIFKIIEECAHLYSNPDPDFGHGIPDFERAYYKVIGGEASEPLSFSKDSISIFPVPMRDLLQFEYFSLSDKTISISLIDQSGRVVVSESKALLMGKNILLLPGLNIAQGVYSLFIDGTYYQKIIVS